MHNLDKNDNRGASEQDVRFNLHEDTGRLQWLLVKMINRDTRAHENDAPTMADNVLQHLADDRQVAATLWLEALEKVRTHLAAWTVAEKTSEQEIVIRVAGGRAPLQSVCSRLLTAYMAQEVDIEADADEALDQLRAILA